MRVWRIASATSGAFDGEGTRLFGSRWIPRGVAAVHTSATLSLAALELFVHTDPDLLPSDLFARSADCPENIRMAKISLADLPEDWREFPAPESLQGIGHHWIKDAATAVLSVPSVIIPSERNFVLNPSHPDFARIQLGQHEPFQFDTRMWKRSRRMGLR